MMLHGKTINIDTVLSHGDKGSESGFNNYNDQGHPVANFFGKPMHAT